MAIVNGPNKKYKGKGSNLQSGLSSQMPCGQKSTRGETSEGTDNAGTQRPKVKKEKVGQFEIC